MEVEMASARRLVTTHHLLEQFFSVNTLARTLSDQGDDFFFTNLTQIE